MGHAKALAGIEDFAWQSTLFRQTISDDLSVRALEKLIQQYNQVEPKKRKFPYLKITILFKSNFGRFLGMANFNSNLERTAKVR